MSNLLPSSKTAVLKRDLLRDFCLAAEMLEEQFRRYDKSGTLSFSILQDLLGQAGNKGLMWRVKDVAHHVLRNQEELGLDACRLDWTIGFLFHELIQLLESNYQIQTYGSRIRSGMLAANEEKSAKLASDAMFCCSARVPGSTNITDEEGPEEVFAALISEGNTIAGAHINRCRKIIGTGVHVFIPFLAGEKENRALARLFYDREELIQGVFNVHYPSLLDAVYGDSTGCIPLQAAYSLAETGQLGRALEAVNKALVLNPDGEEERRLLMSLQKQNA